VLSAKKMLKRQVIVSFVLSFVVMLLVPEEPGNIRQDGGKEAKSLFQEQKANIPVEQGMGHAFEWKTLDWQGLAGEEVTLFVNSAVSSNRSGKESSSKHPSKPSSQKKNLGSQKAPFATIDEALSHISTLKKKNKVKVLLHVSGNFVSSYSYIITCPIKIVATSKRTQTDIEFRKNAGFVLSSSFLMLENLTIKRRESVGEPRSVPLFYVSAGSLCLKTVKVDVKEGGAVFVFLSSKFEMDGVSMNSRQADYCNIMEVFASQGRISSSQITGTSRNVVAIDAKKSHVIVDSSSYEAVVPYFALFARLSSSKLYLSNNSLSKSGGMDEEKVAIVLDASSKLEEKNTTVSGFAKLL